MATTYGNTVNGRWCAYMNWSTSSSNTQTTLTVECCLQVNNYSVSYNNVTGDVSIDFSVNKSAKKSINKSYGAGTTYYSFCSASKTFTRGKSASDKAFSAGVTFGAGSSNWAGSSRAYGTLTVQPKPSYKVSYNANGGSGAPGAQTKWYGENLTLSSTKPTRTGHSFQGWATSSGGSVAYASGASYTGNAALTLYAVWRANTYAVTYNANGGSGAPGAQTKTYGQTLYLSSTRPTRTNYNFKGWATSATATTAQYQPGGAFTTNAATTLYAVWELAYINPRITNLAANRCNSAGTYAEDGTYARITFNWATDRSIAAGAVKMVCNGTTYTASGTSGTSGSVSQVVGAGALSTENSYTVTVTVTDSGGSSTSTTVVAPLAYIMDFAPNGSVAVGEPANGSTREFSVATPIVMKDYMRGLHESGNFSSWRYKILARGSMQNSSDGSYGHIRIFGVLGGWTSVSKGPIDIYVPTRGGSNTTILISSFSPTLFNNNSARLIVRLGTDGYMYAILAAYQYYSYNLFIDGEQIEVLDNDWSTSVGVSGTDLFNSTSADAIQNGGYPLKVEKLNGYFGFALPDKTRNEWIRTTWNGLIPYQQGGASALGTNTWPFNTAWVNQLNWTGNGLRGRCFKKIWSGTANEGAVITVSEMPYYNLFGFEISTYVCLIPVMRGKNLESDTYCGIGGYGIADGGNARIVSITCNASGSSTKVSLSELNIAGSANITNTANTTLVGIYGIL